MQKLLLGINFSISDIILVILLIKLAKRQQIHVPIKLFVFIIILFSVSLFNTIFLIRPDIEMPLIFISFLMEFVKVGIGVSYFLIAFSLCRYYEMKTVFRGFVYGTTLISLVAVISSIFHVALFNKYFFYEGSSRFVGLFSDPNYFAIVSTAVIALLAFDFNNKLDVKFKKIYMLIILIAILFSGSKTGLILLMVIITSKFVFTLRVNNMKTLIQLFSLIITMLILYLNKELIINKMNELSYEYPVLKRLVMVFTDTETALSGNGSNRANSWNLGLGLIERYPFLGVGIGNYSDTLYYHTGFRGLSHNSYIQVAAEWGLPLMFIFYSQVFINMFIVIKRKYLAIASAMGIILIGSMSVSLNNSRVFWFLFGVIYYLSKITEFKIEGGKECQSVD